MNEDRNQAREPRRQAEQKHPDEWQRDLNPDHLAGQNIGRAAESHVAVGQTAFHLRKRGDDVGPLDDEELKQVPVLADGERLQQGGTYVDLKGNRREEFTATGEMSADPEHAYVPKDRVPYEIWNRLTGKERPRT
jgi:hypothetical protein